MRSDKRSTTRRAMRYAAWLHDGETTPRACVVADMSAEGARLEIDAPDAVPDSFTLLLHGARHERRRCVVVWRSRSECGVQFAPPG